MRSEEERRAWRGLSREASAQHGVVTLAQVARWFTRHQLDLRVERGHLIPAGRGVWRMAGAQVTWRQRVIVACLAAKPPVAASHTTAARLWSLDGIAAIGIHLLVPRDRRGVTGAGCAVVHHGTLGPEDMAQRYSIPVTGPARTIVDLAPVVPGEALARAGDSALRRRILTIDDLRQERARRMTVSGLAVVDEIIARRSARGIGDSEWEDSIFDWIVDSDLPPPQRQFVVQLPSMAAVLDMAYPPWMVAVEFDGFEWHGTRQRFDHDRARASELAAAGWLLVTVTSAQSRTEVVDRVRRSLVSRGWRPRQDAEPAEDGGRQPPATATPTPDAPTGSFQLHDWASPQSRSSS